MLKRCSSMRPGLQLGQSTAQAVPSLAPARACLGCSSRGVRIGDKHWILDHASTSSTSAAGDTVSHSPLTLVCEWHLHAPGQLPWHGLARRQRHQWRAAQQPGWHAGWHPLAPAPALACIGAQHLWDRGSAKVRAGVIAQEQKAGITGPQSRACIVLVAKRLPRLGFDTI